MKRKSAFVFLIIVLCIAILVAIRMGSVSVSFYDILHAFSTEVGKMSGITGISSGASVIVMIVMLYIPSATGGIPIFGFIGGILACILIYSLAWKQGLSAVRIVLAGVAVNAVLGGITSMISILNSENLSGVLNWLNGQLGKKAGHK